MQDHFASTEPTKKNKVGKERITRTSDKEQDRFAKRVCVTVSTLLREALGLPLDPNLNNPKPIPEEDCYKHLIAVLEGNPEQLGGHAGDSFGGSPENNKDHASSSTTQSNVPIGESAATFTCGGSHSDP